MAITEPFELDGVTIGATEKSIPANANYSSGSPQTGDGAYQLWVDGSTLAKGDEYRVKLYEKCLSGGTQRVLAQWSLLGAAPSNLLTPSFMLINGWDMTIQKIAGTDRAFDASVRSVAATITEAYTISAVSVSTSEKSVLTGTTTAGNGTTDGAYQLIVDASAMAKGDDFRIRLKEKVEGTGGSTRTFQDYRLKGVQAELFASPTFTLINGFDVTIVREAGADANFTASLRRVG